MKSPDDDGGHSPPYGNFMMLSPRATVDQILRLADQLAQKDRNMRSFYRLSFESRGGFCCGYVRPYPQNMQEFIEAGPQGSVEIVVAEGHRPSHVLGTGLWSKGLIATLERAGATGFRCYDAPNVTTDGVELANEYMGVVIYGRGGAARFGEQQYTDELLVSYRGIFASGTSGSSDVFLLDGAGVAVFVSKHVGEQLLQLADLRNLRITSNESCTPST